MGEMFLPETLLRVDLGTFFNPAASDISPLFSVCSEGGKLNVRKVEPFLEFFLHAHAMQ